MIKRPRHILPLIILSQFAGTSLWFAGNAILPGIQKELDIAGSTIGNITSAVQFGFIAGTLVFALLAIADRFAPSKVFFVSSLIAAAANVSIIWIAKDAIVLLTLRFVTGFFLAGIYPVGMKIAADWYEKGLGKTLGFLVGALVLGKAFPFLLTSFYALPWKLVLLFTSLFAVSGGLLILFFVEDGPYRKQAVAFHPSYIARAFRSADFRASAFGYFGHMWELYTFWAFVPVILQLYAITNNVSLDTSFWSFVIIAIGCLSCIGGGYLSQRIGSSRVAFYALLSSAACCVLAPFLFTVPAWLFLLFMMTWGIAVIADSPQFSTLTAQTAAPEYRGTAITIVICIGFSITIASIQLLQFLHDTKPLDSFKYFLAILAIGPVTGLFCLFPLFKKGSAMKT